MAKLRLGPIFVLIIIAVVFLSGALTSFSLSQIPNYVWIVVVLIFILWLSTKK